MTLHRPGRRVNDVLVLDDDPAVESLHQLTSSWRTLALDVDPAADVRDLPGIAVCWPDSPLVFLRLLAFTDARADTALLRQRIGEAAALIRSKPDPGLLWMFTDLLTPDARDALPGLMGDTGFELAYAGEGQAGDILPIPEPSHPRLTFERATTEAQMHAFADINAAAYGAPPEDFRAGLPASGLWTSTIHAYLGCEDGTPVTAAATMEVDGRLFVLFVATVPEAQRQGYGEAVTRRALYEGGRATGLRRATLQATADGAPVYPRIGFVPNSPMHMYGLTHS